jgi:uncharacterized membrane protein
MPQSQVIEQKRIHMLTAVFVISWLVLCTIAPIVIKTGVKEVPKIEEFNDFFNINFILSLISNKYIITGLSCYFIATLMWIVALSRLDVSLLSPLGSLAFVFTAILALIFLGEKISSVRWLGISLVVLGTFLLLRS